MKKRKIHRRCKCGCGNITNYGYKYIFNHHLFGNTYTLGRKHSDKAKRKISLARKGQKQSKNHILNRTLARIKYNPNYEYCEVWHDKEYKDDLRKDYCENIDCKKISKQLGNHHIYLDKKRCNPNDIMTMCNSCHATLHLKLAWRKSANPKHYVIINRPGHVSYILKKSRKIIRINKRR